MVLQNHETRRTSKDSNSPDENALVNFDRQRRLIISFFFLTYFIVSFLHLIVHNVTMCVVNLFQRLQPSLRGEVESEVNEHQQWGMA